jgi:hypothetical protein
MRKSSLAAKKARRASKTKNLKSSPITSKRKAKVGLRKRTKKSFTDSVSKIKTIKKCSSMLNLTSRIAGYN